MRHNFEVVCRYTHEIKPASVPLAEFLLTICLGGGFCFEVEGGRVGGDYEPHLMRQS